VFTTGTTNTQQVGGIRGRTEATGLGVFYGIREFLKVILGTIRFSLTQTVVEMDHMNEHLPPSSCLCATWSN
jgi:glutamate dehydrogenase/leucine dehydrogenase